MSRAALQQVTESDDENSQANLMLGVGLGMGAYLAATAALTSFVCPVCAIATPVLLGAGTYKKFKVRRSGRSLASTIPTA